MKQEDKQFDIFISYRRDGGVETARLLYERLTNAGYRVSFDMETLRSGKFNTQLYERIEHCKDVIVLLNSKALELRENPSDDWFRLEVAHALKHQKNIIPVFLRDFNWPDKRTLPDDIADLCDYEGVSASDEHFDSTFNKLCRLLKSRPVHSYHRLCLVVLAILLLIGAGGTGYYFRNEIFPYPVFKLQRQHFGELLYVLEGQGTCVNQLFSMKRELLNAAHNALSSDSYAHFLEAYNVFTYDLQKLNIEKWEISKDLQEKVQNMPFELVDVKGAYDYLQMVYQEAKREADSLKNYMDKKNPMPKSELFTFIQIQKDYLELHTKYYSYIQMAIFKDISPKRLQEYFEIVRKWTNLPKLSEPWERKEQNLKNLLEQCMNSMEAKNKELIMLVGNMNASLNREGDAYKQNLIESGATSEQAEKMLEKARNASTLKTLLDQKNKQITDEIREKAWKKFEPLETDEPGVLWGKTLRFLSLNLTDEALKAIAMLRKKPDEIFGLIGCDVMEAFIRQREELPFKKGIMVCGFEAPATSHAIYKKGDIVSQVDGKPCEYFDAYKALIGTNAKVQIWRLENGRLISHEAVMPAEQPRTMMLELAEKME